MRSYRPEEWLSLKHQHKRFTDAGKIVSKVAVYQLAVVNALADTIVIGIHFYFLTCYFVTIIYHIISYLSILVLHFLKLVLDFIKENRPRFPESGDALLTDMDIIAWCVVGVNQPFPFANFP